MLGKLPFAPGNKSNSPLKSSFFLSGSTTVIGILTISASLLMGVDKSKASKEFEAGKELPDTEAQEFKETCKGVLVFFDFDIFCFEQGEELEELEAALLVAEGITCREELAVTAIVSEQVEAAVVVVGKSEAGT